MIDEYSEAFINGIREKADEDPVSNGKWHRAYLESTILDGNSSNKIVSAYTAALFTDPITLSALKDEIKSLYEELSKDGLDEVTAAIIRLAIEELWYSELFRVGNLNNEMKEEASERLASMINSK
ncbi:hypothetical protein [Paenibacillus sp. USHLN196]|uniref:hypothetical protein n=1 Tax=Paenibacillus sp. USHLN196 TaxID=3081291 RepID=UPI0030179B1E